MYCSAIFFEFGCLSFGVPDDTGRSEVPVSYGAPGYPKGSALGRRRRRRLGGEAGGTQACSYSPRGSKGKPLAQSGNSAAIAMKLPY